MPVAFITHPDCLLHEMGEGHPEEPSRLRAIEAQLHYSDLEPSLLRVQAQPATRQQLLRVHGEQHLDLIDKLAPAKGYAQIDPDTSMNQYTARAAYLAAGAAVQATDLVIAGRVSSAFCAVRPPGHHAERDRAMGFCFFNNVAVAVAHALDTHELTRVAVVDFDVHHGNGTEDIIAGDERVLMVSIFQHPLYPYTGPVPMGTNMINVPVPPYTRGPQIRALIEENWMERLDAFRPEMIFVSAGFDAHREDELGQLGLVEADNEWITIA